MFERLQIFLTSLCGLFLALMFFSMVPGWRFGTPDAFAIGAILTGSVFALRSGWEAVSERRLDVNLLMLLAGAGAMVLGHYDDAAVLLFLFSLSSALEAMAMAKTQSAIEALVKLQPSEALRVHQLGDQRVPVEELQLGDEVRVLPFENVPTDGELLSANASISEAMITGESIPVEKVVGAKVIAGTQNLDRMFTMKVTSTVGDSTLERIVSLVRESQENKASGERVSAWFGARYTLFVLGVFVLSMIVRTLIGESFMAALNPSLVLLVALSPCALVISSPAASLSALAYAARRGILVRGGQFLEEAGRISVVAMDKTGTLTEGKPKVLEICLARQAFVPAGAVGKEDDMMIQCWHAGSAMNPETAQFLKYAAGAEEFSTHPIAEAIVKFAKAQGVEVPEAEQHQVFPGFGVEATITGKRVRVGQSKFFESELPAHFQEHVDEMRERGITAVLVSMGDDWAAIGLRDEPREDAQNIIANFHNAGVHEVAMLTGDNVGTARAVAEQLGIDTVHAELMPESKLELVKKWTGSGKAVMMVGDGVNDAPALTAANLGVAMGGLGSEAALRASDVVLVNDRVNLLPELIRLGRMTNRIIRANLVFAAGIIIALFVLSLFNRLPLALAVIGHEGSTALVVLNGLRLLAGPGRSD